MDALSDILSLLRPRAVETSGLVSGADWALDFPHLYRGVKFGAVVRGGCWLKTQGISAPLRLETGDCYLMAGGPYWLGSDVAVPAIDARTIFDANTPVARYGDSDETFLVGGRLTFDESHAILLTGILPSVMHIPASLDEAAVLRWTLDRLAKELTEMRPGSSLLAEYLGQILFVNVLRVHMTNARESAPGWLKGLSDPHIGRALRAMHEEPARRWTLEALARTAGMSRTAFALRFKALVGWSPLDYLLHWRMRLAARALTSGGARLSEIAFAVGYESEAAFSAAFKRVMGCAPKHYQMQSRRMPTPDAEHARDKNAV